MHLTCQAQCRRSALFFAVALHVNWKTFVGRYPRQNKRRPSSFHRPLLLEIHHESYPGTMHEVPSDLLGGAISLPFFGDVVFLYSSDDAVSPSVSVMLIFSFLLWLKLLFLVSLLGRRGMLSICVATLLSLLPGVVLLFLSSSGIKLLSFLLLIRLLSLCVFRIRL